VVEHPARDGGAEEGVAEFGLADGLDKVGGRALLEQVADGTRVGQLLDVIRRRCRRKA